MNIVVEFVRYTSWGGKGTHCLVINVKCYDDDDDVIAVLPTFEYSCKHFFLNTQK